MVGVYYWTTQTYNHIRYNRRHQEDQESVVVVSVIDDLGNLERGSMQTDLCSRCYIIKIYLDPFNHLVDNFLRLTCTAEVGCESLALANHLVYSLVNAICAFGITQVS